MWKRFPRNDLVFAIRRGCSANVNVFCATPEYTGLFHHHLTTRLRQHSEAARSKPIFCASANGLLNYLNCYDFAALGIHLGVCNVRVGIHGHMLSDIFAKKTNC